MASSIFNAAITFQCTPREILNITDMSAIFKVLTTRELALIIWLILLLCAVLFQSKLRYHVKEILKTAFHPQLLPLYGTFLIYVMATVALLRVVGFWDSSLLKDTVFWLLFSAMNLFFGISFNLDKIRDGRYFGGLIKDNLKSSISVEFLINLYSFRLWIELVMLPIMALLVMTNTYAELSSKRDDGYKKAHSCLNYLLGIIGLIYIGYAIYKTIGDPKAVFSVAVGKELLLPLLLMLLFIPYLYALALYFKFETMFIANNVLFKDKARADRLWIKFYTLFYGNFSFKRVHRIWRNLGVLAYENNVNYRAYIKRVASAPAYKKLAITNIMSIGLFNDIDACCKSLLSLGLGEFNEWNKPDGFDSFYCSTAYYIIVPEGYSNISLSLEGDEQHIHQLELSLSIIGSEEREVSILKFNEFVHGIFKRLSLQMAPHIHETISESKNFSFSNDIYSVELLCEANERMERFDLSLRSMRL